MKPVFFTMLLTVLIGPGVASAKLDVNTTQPLSIPVNTAPSNITEKDVEDVIPMDIHPTNDANSVANRIADRGLQAWFNSPAVKGSSLGQTADQVQHKMSTDITLKSDEPTAIAHKFTMQVLALQAMARIQYSGWVHAVFNYDARASQSMVELSEKIFDKNLFVNHISSSKEEVSSIGIKWGW